MSTFLHKKNSSKVFEQPVWRLGWGLDRAALHIFNISTFLFYIFFLIKRELVVLFPILTIKTLQFEFKI